MFAIERDLNAALEKYFFWSEKETLLLCHLDIVRNFVILYGAYLQLSI